VERFSTQITPRPVFKKFPWPATEGFYHLKTFLKVLPSFLPSFTILSTKNLYNCQANDPFEILHDLLPGRDPSVEKRWSRLHIKIAFFRKKLQALWNMQQLSTTTWRDGSKPMASNSHTKSYILSIRYMTCRICDFMWHSVAVRSKNSRVPDVKNIMHIIKNCWMT